MPVGVTFAVYVVAKNISGHPITAAYGQSGFDVALRTWKTDGNSKTPCISRGDIDYLPGYEIRTLPADWMHSLRSGPACLDKPGEITLQGVVSSQGPYWKKAYNPAAGQWEAWTGEVKSEETHIRIISPQGIDKKAYEATNRCPMCKPDALLGDFPTSTYAAYAVWHLSGAEGMGRSDPGRIIADRSKDGARTPLEVINLLEMINVPYDIIDGKKIGGEIHGKVAIAWRAKWFGIVLKAHPDIWFANELKLRTAIDQLTLKNYQAAQAELEAIAKDDEAPMAPKAKEYLGLMKQKGWIKN
jgi:hypothetical protein